MRNALLVSLITVMGCGIADFDISQSIPAQTIPGSQVPTPLSGVFPLPLNLDLNSQIQSRNTGAINAITLSSLTLHITSSGSDWSFVKTVDVSVESTKSGTTLPKVKIASVASPGPGAVQTMSFEVEGSVNLKPYVDEGSQVDSAGTGTEPTSNVTFDGTTVFTIHPF